MDNIKQMYGFLTVVLPVRTVVEKIALCMLYAHFDGIGIASIALLFLEHG